MPTPPPQPLDAGTERLIEEVRARLAEYGLADPGPGGPLKDPWFRYISDNIRAGRGR